MTPDTHYLEWSEAALAPPLDLSISFGVLGRETRYGDGTWSKAEDVVPVLPRADWQPISNADLVWNIYDQLDGHCAANAATKTLECLRKFAGVPDEKLAPESLYMQHSRWGTGSNLEENLRQLRDVGVLTRATFPQSRTPRGLWLPEKWEQTWLDEARLYRVLEWFDCDGDFDLGASALQRRRPLVIGVRWPGGGGHSVVVTDLVRIGKSDWGYRGPNSWGANWGDKGFFVLSERQLRSGIGFGSWAGRSCVIPSL